MGPRQLGPRQLGPGQLGLGESDPGANLDDFFSEFGVSPEIHPS